MYRIPVYRIALVRERTLAADNRYLSNPEDAAALVRAYLADTDREHFVAICLDTKYRVLAINTVSVGTLDAASVHPREVFKAAVLTNSAAVIVAHNHPSGDPTASADDRRITEQLVNAGKILGIPVLDHVIVGEREFTSLREQGVIT